MAFVSSRRDLERAVKGREEMQLWPTVGLGFGLVFCVFFCFVFFHLQEEDCVSLLRKVEVSWCWGLEEARPTWDGARSRTSHGEDAVGVSLPGTRGVKGPSGLTPMAAGSFAQLELVWALNASKKIRNRNISKREVWQPSCAETRCRSS